MVVILQALKSLAIMTFISGGDEDTDNMLTVLWEVGSYDKVSHAHEVNNDDVLAVNCLAF